MLSPVSVSIAAKSVTLLYFDIIIHTVCSGPLINRGMQLNAFSAEKFALTVKKCLAEHHSSVLHPNKKAHGQEKRPSAKQV